MFKFSLSKLQLFAPLIYNILTKKNIVILLGDKGSYILAINNNKIINRLFIPLALQNNIDTYKYFLNKFRKYNIFLLLDDKISQLRHESIPVIQSVVKIDPVEKFIKDHFNPNEIVAHGVYNINAHQGEVWQTLVASVSINTLISNIINCILHNSLNLGGVYFLSLEFISIIDNILLKINKKNQYEFALQFFITPTESYGIKIVTKHRGNILHIHTVDYPHDKSEIYVQGIIEQQILDALIKFKSYIKDNNLKVCIILLVGKTLKELLLQSNFEDCSVEYISYDELDSNKSNLNSGFKFADKVLAQAFCKHKKFLGFNKSIKTLTKLTLINSLLFKPFILVTLVLICIVGSIKFKEWQISIDTLRLNKKYYLIANEYRNLKAKYPNIKNVTNIADLYSMEALLKIPLSMPFETVEQFISLLPSKAELSNIDWVLKNYDVFQTKNVNSSLEALINFNSSKQESKHTQSEISKYLSQVNDTFKGYKFSVNRPDNISLLSSKIIISVSILLSENPK